jgi:hypothetical protein
MSPHHANILLLAACLRSLFLTGSQCIGQVDTSLRAFFPIHIGDYWEYKDEDFPEPTLHYYLKVKRDTLMPNGKTYFAFNFVEIRYPTDTNSFYYYRLDDSMRVWSYSGDISMCPAREYVSYQLTAADREIWPVCVDFVPTSQQEYIGLYSTQVDYFPHLGIDTVSKLFIGPVYMENSDTIWGGAYFFKNWLARGLGVARAQGEAGPPIYLIGAIINGQRYGYITSVDERRTKPIDFALQQNYPNPFNPSTSIRYDLAGRSHATITVHDLLGQLVATLVNRELGPGSYTIQFNAERLSSGVYFYRLNTEGQSIVKKMIVSR